MSKFAYARVSSDSQNPDRQFDMFAEKGIIADHIYLDKLSGKDTKRPKLQELLKTLKQGDTVIVESFSRFTRNTRDLLELVEQLKDKGVEFVSLKENVDTNTPTGKLMLTVFAGIYEFERECILQRQAEGIAAAKSRGKHLGRPIKKEPKNFANIAKRWESKEISLQKVLKECGDICPATFYKWLAEYRSQRDLAE